MSERQSFEGFITKKQEVISPGKKKSLDPILHAHIDELLPPVRTYAKNLQAQILLLFKKHGAKDYASFKALARAKDSPVSKDDVEQFERLAQELKRTLTERTIAFDQEKMYQIIDTVILRQWGRYVQDWVTFTDEDLEALADFLKQLIRDSLSIPPDILKTNSHFLNEILHHCSEELNPQQSEGVRLGLFISILFNEIVEQCPVEERDTIVQQIHTTGLRNSKEAQLLAYKNIGGRIEVSSDQEPIEYFAWEMQGGHVIADDVDDCAGQRMSGGFLEVRYARRMLGGEMTGGHIICQMAGAMAGQRMRGGELQVYEAGHALGEEMIGGEIRVDHAGEITGKSMEGGTITAKKLGPSAGDRMRGGEIVVEEVGNALGMEMEGGRIRVSQAGDRVGYAMRDGTIIVGTAGEELGRMMNGGKILVSGTAGRKVGFHMQGGEIEVTQAGKGLGMGMIGGSIRVLQSVESVSDFERKGGEIFVQGKRIGLPETPVRKLFKWLRGKLF